MNAELLQKLNIVAGDMQSPFYKTAINSQSEKHISGVITCKNCIKKIHFRYSISEQEHNDHSHKDIISSIKGRLTINHHEKDLNWLHNFYRIYSEGFFLDRISIAIGLSAYDVLFMDTEELVRKRVAKRGLCLDELIPDKSPRVRATIAEQGFGLDKLISDPSAYVRVEVAKQGYGLEVLVNDENSYVRAAVARQGFALYDLLRDENKHVRQAALEYKESQDI